MRRFPWLAAAAAVFVLSTVVWGHAQQGQEPATNAKDQSQTQGQLSKNATPATPKDPLAEAARKAREQKKEAPKATKVYDNDTIPTQGGISTIGETSQTGQEGAGGTSASANDEKTWRDRFATLHHKLDQDQAELDILQRELGVANVQFYTDPVKEMQQKLTNEDINKKTAAIDAKKKVIEADKQAIANAEEELRKSGGDPGWAR
jgi:hypothetical protein